MIEKLVSVKLPPGLQRNGTRYEAKGRWHSANLVRFHEGTVRPVGGWRTAADSDGAALGALTGVPRAVVAWRASNGSIRLGVGTHSTAYVFIAGVLTNVTPASGFTAGAADSSSASGLYGAGTYGSNLYGIGSAAAALTEASVWQLDNFGDHLVGVLAPSDKKLWAWDGNTANDFAVVTNAPTGNQAVVVTPERFLTVLGAGGSPRKVQWASQETETTWTPAIGNTAGSFELATGGRLICGRRGRDNTLLWTDADLWSMTYIGGSLVYAFQRVADSCGIIAPNAVAVVDGRAFWMGPRGFFAYDGFVKPVPCEVHDHVFGDFNSTQAMKVAAVPVSQYGEIWWFYPSAGSVENDRYVVFNYRENHWTVGALARTAGVDRGAAPNVLLATPGGLLKEHEVLEDREGEVPFIESGPYEVGGGDQVVRVQRIVPDEKTLGDVQARFYTAMYPTDAEVERGPFSLAQPTDVRFTARQVRIRLEEVRPVSWRVGDIRLGAIIGGRR